MLDIRWDENERNESAVNIHLNAATLTLYFLQHILKARVNADDQKMIDIALDAASDHDAGRTFHLRAKDEKEARDWVQCIKKISRHEKERRAKLGTISSGGKISTGNVVGKSGKEADAAFAEAKARSSSSSSVFGKASSTKDGGCLSSCVIS